jgi:mevalonate kinase
MPAISATAPGKAILFGEHAVVYGQPAIAVPINQVRARTMIIADPLAPTGQVRIQAPAIGLDTYLDDLPPDEPLVQGIQLTLRHLELPRLPGCTIRVTSTIPIAAGLGSGAAVSVSLIRALSAFLGSPLPDDQVNKLAYEIEKVHHGTPSGIDNTVITYNQPIYFQRQQPIEFLTFRKPVHLVIGDSGIASKTSITVGRVRQGWQENPEAYEKMFEEIGEITRQARQALERGDLSLAGRLMDENQRWLIQLGVSSPELENLIAAARNAGASGAKLSGGGGGGNMIALVHPDVSPHVVAALTAAGALQILTSEIPASH